jgi:hypothetical protein
MNRHAFTVAEVNAMLPRIRRAAEQVKKNSLHLNRLSEDLYVDSRPEVDTLVDQGYMNGLSQVIEGVEVIGELGGEIKDLSKGMVDFPSTYEGRTVLLCWKPGEETFLHWHDPEEGFAGRTPIEDETEFEGDPQDEFRLEADIEADDSNLV